MDNRKGCQMDEDEQMEDEKERVGPKWRAVLTVHLHSPILTLQEQQQIV
jgi:hypothetical protein